MESNASADVAHKTRNKSRWLILLIIGLPLLLILVSYTLMYLVRSEQLDLVDLLGTKTVGHLMQPVTPLSAFNLTTPDGDVFQYEAEKPQFTLFILQPSGCGQRCQDNLHLSRQMHIALGKKQGQLRRYHLLLDGVWSDAQLDALHAEYPHLTNLYGDQQALERLLASQQLPLDETAYLLVDRRGWIMMAYDESISEKSMMTDLKHLFKYAQ